MTDSKKLSYILYSKDLITSVILLLPFILMYEIISFFKFHDKTYVIRNSADAILRQFFDYFSSTSVNYYSFLLLVFLVFIFIYYKNSIFDFSIKVNFLIFMIIEGLIFGFILLFILNDSSIIYNYNFSYYNDIVLAYYLCIGAGIWEEVLFRFILVNLFLKLFINFKSSNNLNIFISIILAGTIFSTFHYIGDNPDIFTLQSFTIRFIGGFILGYIYIFRGLGIAAITHFCYDFLLFALPVI